jgi:hypothetical protein
VAEVVTGEAVVLDVPCARFPSRLLALIVNLLIQGVLARLPELTPAAQADLGERIAGAVRAQVSPLPPPGTPAVAYLSAVLAERRSREHARLTVSPARGAPEHGAPGSGFPALGSPGPRRAAESPAGAGHPGPAAAWTQLVGATREGEPEHMPPAKGGGGFVPTA